MDILKKFCDSIRSNALFNERDRILLAVSGGVDSVVMLDLFSRIQDRYNLDLRIIHLNHGLRGELADRDEEFVKTLGARYSYRVIAKTVDTASYARKRKMSLENAARTLRYKFYEDLVRSENATAVAVGHNQNDQAETFLDHLTRGSGIKGLVGMKIRRGYIIRPLLTVTRVEIQTFAKKHGIQHVVDHTNLDKKYKRNRIRHELIPYLENNFNPGIIKSLFNTTLILKDADFYLENQARESLKHCIIYCKKIK